MPLPMLTSTLWATPSIGVGLELTVLMVPPPLELRRGARRNRGVARRNRALPARDSARKGWERWGARWNWLAARAGASSEFYEGSLSRREAAGRPPVASGGWPGLSGGQGRRGARRNWGVARRNRALPARDRARCRVNYLVIGGRQSLIMFWLICDWLVCDFFSSSFALLSIPKGRVMLVIPS